MPKQADSNSSTPKKKSDPKIPKTLGNYEIQKKIGSGGMGSVYLAQDQGLKRMVALKVLSQEKSENPILVQRFQAEAQSAAALEHPNIVRIYGSGEDKGYYFIALEYIDGMDLHQLIQRRSIIPVRRSIEIMIQAAQALEHAQASNIVHRDIKPSNFLIDKAGMIKLTDMGLARSMDEEVSTDITRAGTTVGTVDYMAPEQARNSRLADIRSDIYSLGCTWFQMLTGKAPFSEGSLTNKLHAHATQKIPDPREVQENIPEGVVAVLRQMLAKKPENRYQTPTELIKDLSNSKLTRKAVGDDSLQALASDMDPEAYAAKEDYQAEPETDFDYRSEKEFEFNEQDLAEAPAKRKSKKRKTKSKSDSPEEETTKVSSNKAKSEKPKGEKRELPPRDANKSDVVEIKEPFNVIPLVIGVAVIGVVSLFGFIIYSFTQNSGALSSTGNGALGDAVAGKSVEAGNINGNIQKSEGGGEKLQSLGAGNAAPQPPNIPTFKGTTDPVKKVEAPKPPENSQELMSSLSKEDSLPKIQFNLPPQKESAHKSLQNLVSRFGSKAGVIEVTDDGPYTFNGTVNVSSPQVIIRAAKGKSPVFIFEPNEAKTIPMFSVNSGFMKMHGIHIVSLSEKIEDKTPYHLFSLGKANLVIEKSSMTLEGSRTAPMTAVVLNPGSEQKQIVSILDTVIRGQNMGVLLSQSNKLDFECKNSLLISGKEKSFQLDTSSLNFGKEVLEKVAEEEKSEDKEKEEETKEDAKLVELPVDRSFLIEKSIVLSENSIASFSNSANLLPPPNTKVAFNESYVQKIGNTDTTLAVVKQWPENLERESGQSSRMTNLEWKTVESKYLGFKKLLDATLVDNPTPIAESEAKGWQKVWRDSIGGNFTGPKTAATSISLKAASQDIKTLVSSVLSDNELKDVSFDSQQLSVPEIVALQRSLVLSKRITIPDEFFDSESATTIVVDMNKGNPGRTLRNRIVTAKKNEPLLINVIGNKKILKIDPLVVRGQKVKIVFLSDDGDFISIRPEKKAFAKKSKNSVIADSLITVENGSLEIENGQFDFIDRKSSDPGSTDWFMTVRNGSFAIRNCKINAPLTLEDNKGVIRWTTSGFSKLSTRRKSLGIIENTFIKGHGSAIDSEFHDTQLVVSNSVITGTRNSILARLPAHVSGPESSIDIRNSTLASDGSIFKFAGNVPAKAAKSQLSCIAEESIFVPIFNIQDKKASSVVEFAPSEIQKKNMLTWWGDRNGFFTTMVPSINSKSTLEKDWPAFWGKGHVIAPLFGPKGVLLESSPAKKSIADTSEANFKLFDVSEAQKWGAGEQPIGADLTKIKIGEAAKKKSPSNSATKKPPTTKRPAF